MTTARRSRSTRKVTIRPPVPWAPPWPEIFYAELVQTLGDPVVMAREAAELYQEML